LNRSKRRALDSKTNGEARRISENAAFLKISRNFRKVFAQEKKRRSTVCASSGGFAVFFRSSVNF
jgi:hypothetical protein